MKLGVGLGSAVGVWVGIRVAVGTSVGVMVGVGGTVEVAVGEKVKMVGDGVGTDVGVFTTGIGVGVAGC